MRLRRHRTAVLAPLAALVLVLAGCSGGASGDGPTTPASDTRGGETKDTKGEKGDKGGATATPTKAAAAGSDGARCLVGEWVGDEAEQKAAMAKVMADAGIDATFVLSGEVVSAFTADGKATSTYDNQVMDITMGVQGQEIRSVTTMNGVTKGTYTATDTAVTMTITDASGLKYLMDTYVAGTKMDAGLGGTPEELLKQMETTSTVNYTCSGDTLTMTMPNAALGSAVESVLHRR